MNIDTEAVRIVESQIAPDMRNRIQMVVDTVTAAKEKGERVVVVTGSGPNVHEGVTTLIAELIRLGIVDGVTTSSAVVSHEMAGVLDKVKRVDGRRLGIPESKLPHGGTFELSLLDDETLAAIAAELPLDADLIERLNQMPGDTIIKAAGNLGYPAGLYIEHLAAEVLAAARERHVPFEQVAGLGADERTMIGAAAKRAIPALVTIPQLIGGGAVGLAIGDSIPISERAERLALMLEGASVIIESAVVLTQEIHDGPFETYTGHGLWADWQGHRTYSLEGKTLVRIDLDPVLETVWQAERDKGAVQAAVDKGLPKTKLFKVPFRMEMSGFARLEGSIPILGDIGAVWPVLAYRIADRLKLDLDFLSYPQQTPQGQAMREWIVDQIRPFSKQRMQAALAARP